MGRERQYWSVGWTVSRHNSDDDIEHDRLADDMQQRLEAVINDPRYRPIGPMT